MELKLLSGGAAGGLVKALAPQIRERTGAEVSGQFGAVGGMRDRVVAGEAVEIVILTRALIEDLAAGGHVDPATIADLGPVETGVAVPQGAGPADVSSPERLAAALSGAQGIYLSDPEKATAGRHFMRVIEELGLMETLRPRLHSFPSGHIGMAAMAEAGDKSAIGCTQRTEIVTTPGVLYCGPLPPPHGLVTRYTAAAATRAADPQTAREFVALLTGPDGARAREEAGFGSA